MTDHRLVQGDADVTSEPLGAGEACRCAEPGGVALIAMPQLSAQSLRSLVGHPSLRLGAWDFGSTRKNVAAYDLLPLGDPPYGHPSTV